MAGFEWPFLCDKYELCVVPKTENIRKRNRLYDLSLKGILKSCCNSEMTSNIAACSSFIPNPLDQGSAELGDLPVSTSLWLKSICSSQEARQRLLACLLDVWKDKLVPHPTYQQGTMTQQGKVNSNHCVIYLHFS